MTEQELAVKVIDYLTDQGWEIYQEVKYEWGGKIADIVGTRKFKGATEAIVVECKRTYSWDVIEQALNWMPYCNRAYIAVEDKRIKNRRLRDLLLKKLGIGLFIVGHQVREEAGARFHQRDSWWKDKLLDALTDEHKTWASAGSQNGRVVSPFQLTCEKARKWLLDGHQGSPMKDIIASIEHHYSSPASAKNSLRIWIQEGKVRGIRCEPGKGNKPHLYYGEEL